MSGWLQPVNPQLLERCRVYAQGFSIEHETETELPERKGVVHRVRFSRDGESVVRTELRTMFTTRIFVDAKPMGAVLVLLEVGKRKSAPARLRALTGERAGEYADGAIEAAWGAIVLEGSGLTHLLGIPLSRGWRPLHMNQVASLAESIV